MLTTATDLARNLIAAWWPLLLVAALVALPWLLVRALCALDDALTRTFGDPETWTSALDDIMDGDEWADLNGYPRAGLERLLGALDETTEDFEWLPVETPEHRTPIAEAVDFAMWQREVEAG